MSKQNIIFEFFDTADNIIYKGILNIDKFFDKIDDEISKEHKRYIESKRIRYRVIDENNHLETKKSCDKEDYNKEINNLKVKYG